MTITEPITVTGKTEVQAGKVSIGASDLLDLLTGAIIATSKDQTIQTLNGISLVAGDNTLTATATDRYRLITGKLSVTSNASFATLLENTDASKVITALKPVAKRKDPRAIVLEVTGKEITFNLPEVTFTFRLLDGTFPPYEQLLTKEPADSSKMAFNCSLLGSFDGIPTGEKKGRVPVIFTFHGNAQLVTFTVAHNVISWRGGIMGMKFKD